MTVAAGVSYLLPKISDTADSCIDDAWTALPGPPDGRADHTSLWTGSEMIIWGGDERKRRRVRKHRREIQSQHG